MRKSIVSFLILVAFFISSGVASAHCGKCGKAASADQAGEKQCAMDKDVKACPEHCAKPCCNKVKMNFGPRKR